VGIKTQVPRVAGASIIPEGAAAAGQAVTRRLERRGALYVTSTAVSLTAKVQMPLPDGMTVDGVEVTIDGTVICCTTPHAKQ
jgi:hypothetical protein